MERRMSYSQNQTSIKSINASAKSYTIKHDVKLHWHDCCEMELILSGRGKHIINGHSHPLNPGDLYLFTPADFHSITMEEPIDVLAVMFDEGLVRKDLYTNVLDFEMTGITLLATLSEEHRNTTMHYFYTLINEMNAKSPALLTAIYVEQLLNCILINLLREISDIVSVNTDKQVLTEAILYLHHHYTEPITLTTLAKHLHLTPSYLSSYFAINAGRSFKDYLIELRLRHACRLLVNTNQTVTDICFNCGFSSYSHFIRTFRAHYNTSPLQFRHQHLQDVTKL